MSKRIIHIAMMLLFTVVPMHLYAENHLLSDQLVKKAAQTSRAVDTNSNQERLIANFFPRSSHFSNSPFRNMSTSRDIPVSPKKAAEIEAHYQEILSKIKQILTKEKKRKKSSTLVYTYWQVGEQITREEKRLKEENNDFTPFIERLSNDLEISTDQLKEYATFYKRYDTLADVSPNLTWDHYVALIQLNEDKIREDFQIHAIHGNWSIDVLKKNIQEYRKDPSVFTLNGNTPDDTNKNQSLVKSQSANIFKDVYHFPFIQKDENLDEISVETQFKKHIPQFLNALGKDFCFMGHSIPVQIGADKHIIDMVLFHRSLPGIILVEIKIGPLDVRDIGRFNRYVSFYRHNRQYLHEKNAIGLILCNQVDREELIYALDGLTQRIFVATY